MKIPLEHDSLESGPVSLDTRCRFNPCTCIHILLRLGVFSYPYSFPGVCATQLDIYKNMSLQCNQNVIFSQTIMKMYTDMSNQSIKAHNSNITGCRYGNASKQLQPSSNLCHGSGNPQPEVHCSAVSFHTSLGFSASADIFDRIEKRGV